MAPKPDEEPPPEGEEEPEAEEGEGAFCFPDGSKYGALSTCSTVRSVPRTHAPRRALTQTRGNTLLHGTLQCLDHTPSTTSS